MTLRVPKGYEAYARLFHPASDSTGNAVRWAEVAKACGTTPHAEMQWHAILGLGDANELRGSYAPGDESGVEWAGSDPPIGGIDIDTLSVLCEVLASHAADPSLCLFGLCTVHGFDALPNADIPSLLELPLGRSYIVLAGPLSASDQIAVEWSDELEVPISSGSVDAPPNQVSEHLWQRQAPDLIWPDDHSWFVGSDVDLDSTVIGASAALISAIVESPALEAWRIDESASLAHDADTINSPDVA